MKICLDTCIIIDYLQKRFPFFDYSEEIFLRASRDSDDFYISSNSVTDIYYIMKKKINIEEKVRKYLKILLDLIGVIDVTAEDVKTALESDICDYENAVLCMAARRNAMDIVITRNLSDFKNAPINVMQPEEYLKSVYPI